MSEVISIPSHFNGPLESGQGGYCSGVLAGFIHGAVEVSLRRPVPLESPLSVMRESDRSVRLLDGDGVVGEGRAVPDFGIEVPAPVDLEEAHRARTRYRGLSDGLFSRCFVCGRAREDAFGVFAGPVEGRELVASPWRPPRWTADEQSVVRPEFIWSALDCPTYFALYTGGELPLSVLAQLTARIDRSILAGKEYVVIAWPLEIEGRKRHAASAVLSPEGETLALGRALLIEPRGD